MGLREYINSQSNKAKNYPFYYFPFSTTVPSITDQNNCMNKVLGAKFMEIFKLKN